MMNVLMALTDRSGAQMITGSFHAVLLFSLSLGCEGRLRVVVGLQPGRCLSSPLLPELLQNGLRAKVSHMSFLLVLGFFLFL